MDALDEESKEIELRKKYVGQKIEYWRAVSAGKQSEADAI